MIYKSKNSETLLEALDEIQSSKQDIQDLIARRDDIQQENAELTAQVHKTFTAAIANDKKKERNERKISYILKRIELKNDLIRAQTEYLEIYYGKDFRLLRTPDLRCLFSSRKFLDGGAFTALTPKSLYGYIVSLAEFLDDGKTYRAIPVIILENNPDGRNCKYLVLDQEHVGIQGFAALLEYFKTNYAKVDKYDKLNFISLFSGDAKISADGEGLEDEEGGAGGGGAGSGSGAGSGGGAASGGGAGTGLKRGRSDLGGGKTYYYF